MYKSNVYNVSRLPRLGARNEFTPFVKYSFSPLFSSNCLCIFSPNVLVFSPDVLVFSPNALVFSLNIMIISPDNLFYSSIWFIPFAHSIFKSSSYWFFSSDNMGYGASSVVSSEIVGNVIFSSRVFFSSETMFLSGRHAGACHGCFVVLLDDDGSGVRCVAFSDKKKM